MMIDTKYSSARVQFESKGTYTNDFNVSGTMNASITPIKSRLCLQEGVN